MSVFRISSLRDIVFGRFKGESVSGFDHPFVVVYGQNESGKSTLTEFLTWMIGGPSGNAKNAMRFGEPEQKIGGRLIGSIDSDILEVSAQFTVKKRDAPNDVRTGTLGGLNVSATSLSDRLRQLSADDFAFIYRFIGPTLHDTDGDSTFSGVLSRFAIGAAASDVNPREVAKKIADDAKALNTQIGQIDAAIRVAKSKLKEASDRPQRVSAIEEELSDLNDALERKKLRAGELARDVAFFDSALKAFDINEEFVTAERAKEATPQIPVEWKDAVANEQNIRQVVENIQTAVQAADDATLRSRADAQVVGESVPKLSTITFTNVERSQIRQAGLALSQAALSRDSAQRSVANLSAENLSAMASVRESATQLGVDVSRLMTYPSLKAKFNDINSAAITWRHADGDARTKEADAAKDQVIADEAEQKRIAIEEAPRGTSSSARNLPLVAMVACAVLAGLGAFIHPVVSGVFAMALVALLVSRKSATNGESGTNSEEVMAARSESAVTKQQAIASLSLARQARVDADRREKDFEKIIEPFGVPLPSVDFSQHMYEMLVAACSLVDTAIELEVKLKRANDDAEAAASAELEAAKTFTDVCSRIGISLLGLPENLDEWLDDYQQAVKSAQDEAAKKSELQDLRRSLLGLLGNVPAVVTNYPLDRIIEELNEYVQQHDAYKIAVERESKARIAANAAVGQQDAVKEILQLVQTKAEIEVKKSALVNELSLLNDEIENLQEMKGRLNTERETIEKEEVINGLTFRISDLEEQREELIPQRDAKELAATTLGAVIDKFELENQAPLVKSANELLNAVVPGYGNLLYSRSGNDPVIERDGPGGRLNSAKLSTGSRALIYLALRLAFVEADNDQRGIALPVLCDDPLVHIDDHRAPEVMKILQQASHKRQVILFTCHEETRDLAVAAGAHVVAL